MLANKIPQQTEYGYHITAVPNVYFGTKQYAKKLFVLGQLLN